MARKSNKTAHVLNLLAGHDAAKETDEQQASAIQNTSNDTTAQASPEAPGGAAPGDGADIATGQAIPSNTTAATGNTNHPAATPATPPAAASTPAPAAPPQNNIAMIDKTEDDPVAELIQQKLSSEFEKQIQESAPASAENTADISVASVPQTEPPMQETASAPQTEPPMQETAPAPQTELPIQETAPIPQTEPSISESAPQTEPLLSESAPTLQADDIPVPAAETVPALDTAPVHTEEAVPVSQEMASTPAAAETVSVQEPISETQAAVVADSAAETISAQEDAPSLQMTDTASVPEPVSAPEPEPDFAAVNVMEHIVNDKIIYFMRQFDVCTCSRCKADVTALTLNGLMPKYIVTMKAAVDPLLSYYTNRLISDVTVEATKACMVVKENPRH